MPYIGKSWSVNAQEARDEGRKPISCITKEDISTHGVDVSITFFRWFVGKYCKSGEWHHTSPKYNMTTFYDIEVCCNQFKEADITKLKAEYKESQSKKKAASASIADTPPYYAKIIYSVKPFKGKRRYYEKCALIYKGWAHFEVFTKKDANGVPIIELTKKNISGGYIDIIEECQTRPEEMPEEVAAAIFAKLKLTPF